MRSVVVKRVVAVAVLCVLTIAGAAQADEAASSTTLRRMALLVSANDGGFGRPRLRWTGDDARAMGAVLEELGGVDARDLHFVNANDTADVEEGLARLDDDVQRARAVGARVELIVYYSGHSDADGLLLGNDRLPWSTLRARVAELRADVRVVIMDSCSSGAFVRSKGGKHLPPFVLNDSGSVRGHAFLTSSREDEPAQESDRVRGSFFTHALVSGLRGAADATGDGLVTLNEAYQFAFQETLARTELAAGGAQHPAYDIQLAGSGEWIVTNLRDSSAGVVLAADVVGRVLLRDDRGHLVAELRKGPAEVALSVPAGRYDVRVLVPGKAFSTTITVKAGERTTVGKDSLAPDAVLATTRRGTADDVGDDRASKPSFAFVNAGLVPPLQTNSVFGDDVDNALGLHLLAGSQRSLVGFDLGAGVNVTTAQLDGAALAGVGNVVGAHATGVLVAGAGNVAMHLTGLALGGAGNVVGNAEGVLLAGAANVAVVDVHGLMLAGAANVTTGPMTGAALAGAFNHARDGMQGVQVSGGLNVAGLDSVGLAFAPLNVHERLQGAQIGVVNIGGDVSGTQVGVLNIAGRVRGAQVGLVNVASEADVAVGLVSAVGNGVHSVGVMGTDLFPVMVAARLGAVRNYGVLEAGWSPYLEDGHQIVTLRAGPGVRFPLSIGGQALHLDVEAVCGVLHRADNLLSDGLQLTTSTRALLRWSALPWLTVYGGPAVNVFVLDHRRVFNVFAALPFRGEAVDTLITPGFALGFDL